MKNNIRKLFFSLSAVCLYLMFTAGMCCKDSGCTVTAQWNLNTSKCNIPVWGSLFTYTDDMRSKGWKVKLKTTSSSDYCWENEATASLVSNSNTFYYTVPTTGTYYLRIEVTSPGGCTYVGDARVDNGCYYTLGTVGSIY